MIEGQVAIVTGASRGLGRAIAQKLAAERMKVALTARSRDELEGVAREIREAGGDAHAFVLDVTRWSEVERVAGEVRQRLGSVSVLVNNAGIGWYKPFVEHSVEELDLTLDVNLKGTIYMTKAVLPQMLDAHHGQIVNISSDLGRRVIPNMAAYVAAKHGVMGFASSLLRELKGSGIKVMTLTPGIIDTFFGGGQAGTREETWSLKPEFVAETVASMLKLPQHWMIDELAMHAMGQDF